MRFSFQNVRARLSGLINMNKTHIQNRNDIVTFTCFPLSSNSVTCIYLKEMMIFCYSVSYIGPVWQNCVSELGSSISG